MQIDPEQLRRQYAELTDAALLEIDGAELVDAARQCYEDELSRRRIRPPRRHAANDDRAWLPDALPAASGHDILDEQAVLTRAGIPSHVTVEQEDPGYPPVQTLLVPPGQHLLALSILDRDYFNPITEETWKNHFAVLSDQELLDIDADVLVAGMKDRVERLVRAYEDELLKRGLAELETD